jgi:ketosteroid isomerase-like protein
MSSTVTTTVVVPRAVLEALLAADAKDAAAFVTHLTSDAVFRYANAPPAVGREAVRHAVAQFFDAIKALHHEVLNVWTAGDMVFCKGEVRYVRHDDSHAGPFPFINLYRMQDGKIAEYLIYVDISPLWQG